GRRGTASGVSARPANAELTDRPLCCRTAEKTRLFTPNPGGIWEMSDAAIEMTIELRPRAGSFGLPLRRGCMPRQIVRFLLGILFAAGVVLDATAQAQPQNWPQRTVRLIVPNPPGTATDVTARLYAERLSVRWGKAVVVENRPGPDALL